MKKNKTCPSPSGYWVTFEDYLKPKSVTKQSMILANKDKQKTQIRLKLLEHPVLVAGHKSKYVRFKERIMKYVPKPSSVKVSFGPLKFYRLLSFLYARNDKVTCKRKSGFEIYCELASIHGFKNFVGATTLQRTFWFLVVLMAVVMSGLVLLVSHFMTLKTPTLLYLENTLYPTWEVPFPAVTICNLNRISKVNAESLAKSFRKPTNLTINELTNYFKLALFSTDNIKADSSEYQVFNDILKVNNFTMQALLHKTVPSCRTNLLKCLFQGNFIRCGYLFRQIQTSFGYCCSFNYAALKKFPSKTIAAMNGPQLYYISKSGYINGLSVLLDARLDDYKASSILTAGFRILIHDVYDFADEGTANQFVIKTGTFNNIRIWPTQTYATEHISSLPLNSRKCYLPQERKLFHFVAYSLGNCLAECRSLMFFQKCNCALPHWPKMQNWSMCGLTDAQCYLKHKYLLFATLRKHSDSMDTNEEQFICNCYPSCDFNMYEVTLDSGQLSRKYSLTEKRLFENFNITDHTLLRVFVSEQHMKRFRLDVCENWLSFLGTFGGITGLYMGYSFISGFELIFFVLVRPACNWWTKKRIEKRIKRRTENSNN